MNRGMFALISADIERTKEQDSAGNWRTTPAGRIVRGATCLALAAGIVVGCIYVASTNSTAPAGDGLHDLAESECYNFGNGSRSDPPFVRPGEPPKILRIRRGVCRALHNLEVAGRLSGDAHLRSASQNASDCVTTTRNRVGVGVQMPMSTEVVAFRFSEPSSTTVYCLLQFSPPHQGHFLQSAEL